MNEAEFSLDDRSPLKLYDCLLPKLKEHRKFRMIDATSNTPGVVADFRSILEARQLEHKIKHIDDRRTQLEGENQNLRA